MKREGPGMRCMPGWLRVAGLLLALAGCAGTPPAGSMPTGPSVPGGSTARAGSTIPVSVQVAGVPHFPQTALACGPAALASLLHVAGHPQDVATLSARMITPGLGGALQADLLGAARRAGALPVRIGGDLAALQVQLQHGRPVLALLNLALPRWPRWHYVVVSALDADAGRVVTGAPDGTTEGLRPRAFLRSWGYADGWAIVVLDPGDAPHGLARADYLEAVIALESTGALDAAARGYAAGRAHWPDDDDMRLGAGNVAATRGDLAAADEAFTAVLGHAPAHVAALNNLAEVRRRQGRAGEARTLALRALEHARPGAERDAVLDTLAGIARCGDGC